MLYTRPYLNLQVPALTEPVSLAEFKSILKIDHNDLDSYLDNILKAARQSVENYIDMSLITQTWSMKVSCFNQGEIQLPRGPIQQILTVSFQPYNGSGILLTNTEYELEEDYLLLRRVYLSSQYVEVLYRAGFGDFASYIPEDIKQAIIEEAIRYYECSEDKDMPVSPLLSSRSEKLLSQYRQINL